MYHRNTRLGVRSLYRRNIRAFCAGNTENASNGSDKNLTCLYDGECPLCMKEINWLKRKDIKENIEWVDISEDDYDPSKHGNIDYRTAMESMHVLDKDGNVKKSIHAFKPMYDEVGLGWLWTWTKLPILSNISSFAYDQWAKYRTKITGRPPLDQVVREREERLANKNK